MYRKFLLFCLLPLTCLSLAIFLISSKNSVVKITPFGSDLPRHSHSFFPDDFWGCKTLAEQGYPLKWMLLKEVPGKNRFKKLKYYFKKYRTKAIIFNNINHSKSFAEKRLRQFDSKKLILVRWEPPVIQPQLYDQDVLECFDRVLTWNDDLVDGKKFFKFNYPEKQALRDHLPSYFERKFLCMIATNIEKTGFNELYSTRKKAVLFFDRLEEDIFDLYGSNWDGFSHAKGRIEDKLKTLAGYRFSLCFENSIAKGYITEKIFNCFCVGTIPIYFGAPNILDKIPGNCFIDFRDFQSMEALFEHLKQLSEKDYQTYLNHIKVFLNSEEAEAFSQKAFSETLVNVLHAVEGDLNKKL